MPLLLLAPPLLLFGEALAYGRILFDRDIHVLWYPRAPSFRDSVAAGAFPLWDPFFGFGQPLLANPGAQILYPTTWLLMLLPEGAVYTIYAVGHVLFGGFGQWRLARRLGAGRAGAVVAGLLWMTAGPIVSLVSLLSQLAGAAWMPWVLLAAENALRSRRPWDVVLWGAAVAAQVLAGSPDMCAMTLVLMAVQALRFARRGDGSLAPNLRTVGSVALAAALALGLSAAQWLPTLEVARLSSRFELPADMRGYWSLPPVALLQAIVPVFPQWLPLRPEWAAYLYESRWPLITSCYLGLAALPLVVAACAHRARRAGWLVLVLVASAILALGRHTPAYAMLVGLVPLLRVSRYPVKAIVVTAFVWSLLAGLGFAAWERPIASRRRWALRVATPALAAAGLAWALWAWASFGADAWGPRVLVSSPGASLAAVLALTRHRLAFHAALGAVATLLAVLRLGRGGPRRGMGPILTALALLDLGFANRSANPTAVPQLLSFRPPAVDVIRADGGSRVWVYEYDAIAGRGAQRLGRERAYLPVGSAPLAQELGLRSYLFPPIAASWRLRGSYDIDFTGLAPSPLAELSLFARAADDSPVLHKLLRLGAVDHVLSLHTAGFEGLVPVASLRSEYPEPIRVWRVPDALPRAFAVAGARVADGRDALRALADPGFDPAREVVLPPGPAAPDAARVEDTEPPGPVRIVSERSDGIRLEVDLARPAWVVVADAWDPGWKARVDGVEVPLVRANVAFRAVRVPAGHHAVEEVYRPRGFELGAGISALTLLAAVLLAWPHAATRERPLTPWA